MRFTAAAAWLACTVEAPELKAKPVHPGEIADVFNQKLSELVQDVSEHDEERLATEVLLAAEVVAEDPIDLTASYDEGEEEVISEQREWILIDYIDTADADGEACEELTIVPIEARARAAGHYPGPTVYAIDNMTKLKKLHGFDSVSRLIVYGVLAPAQVAETELEVTEFSYPRALFRALVLEMVCAMAFNAGVRDNRLHHWEQRRQVAYEKLIGDAAQHIASRVEEIPRVNRR